MDSSFIRDYLDSISVLVSGGMEIIRMFKPNNGWISSDYHLSSPSLLQQKAEFLVETRMDSIMMLIYPVNRFMLENTGMIKDLTIGGELLPIVNVSWDEAIDYCNQISFVCDLEPCYALDQDTGEYIWNPDANGYRLPTESEWQHACKAGSEEYQYGEINDIAWHQANSNGTIHAVGLKQPNALGLYDMLGNVWEWCWDTFDPESHPDYRVFRGGSFAEEPRICGSTTRRKSFRTFRMDDLGFRIVRRA